VDLLPVLWLPRNMATKEKGGACCGIGRIMYGFHVVVKGGRAAFCHAPKTVVMLTFAALLIGMERFYNTWSFD